MIQIVSAALLYRTHCHSELIVEP